MTLSKLIDLVLAVAITYFAVTALLDLHKAKGIIDKLTSDWAQEQRLRR